MKGNIYLMWNSQYCYVGSTVKCIYERYAQHYSSFNCWIKGSKNWLSSYNLFMSNETVNIKLLEEVEFSTFDKSVLFQREAYYISQYDCVNEANPYNGNRKKKK